MNLEKYTLISISDFTLFEFISDGPRGRIKKIIQFQKTNEPNLYNLAFGDSIWDTDCLDDLSISNNGDSNKVLATVVSAIYAFFDKHPMAFVYATGSTKSRTRLYRIGITKFYSEIIQDFYLYGQLGNNFFDYEINIDYDGFLAQRKLY